MKFERKIYFAIILVLFVLVLGIASVKPSFKYNWHGYLLSSFAPLLFITLTYLHVLCNGFFLILFSEPFVQLVEKNSILLSGRTKESENYIKELCGTYKVFRRKWLLKYDSEEQLVKYFDSFNNNGFLFEGGVEGNRPAKIFEGLREKGVLQGEFKEVTWKYSGEPTINVK